MYLHLNLIASVALLPALATAAEPSNVVHLFNGKNLDGFYKFIRDRGRDSDPKGVFSVTDGYLRVTGEEWGCVTTNDEFENYHLIVEFRWAGPAHAPRADRARDCGVLLHSVGEDGAYGNVWMHSIECQMIEGGTGDFIVVGDGSDDFSITVEAAPERQKNCPVFQPGGGPVTLKSGRANWWGRDPEWADEIGFRGAQDVEHEVGEWNRYEAIAYKDTITVLLNGVVVNRGTRVKPSKGRIQLQSEGAEVHFRRVDLIPLGDEPSATLLVCNKHDDTMSFVDADTLEVVRTIDVGPNPHEIAVTPNGRFAYLSNYRAPGNTISLIDLVKRQHIKQIPTGQYARIHGAAMAPDGKHAYFTAGQTGFVVEVDTATNEVTRAIPTHGKISHMVLVSSDGERLYTANISTNNVSVIDRASGDLITQVPCGEGVEGMAFTPGDKYLWAANQPAGTITVIDLATHEPVETFPCPGMPVRIRFTPDGKRALVSNWIEQGQLTVIDTATRKELKRITVGSQAIGLEVSPDGKRAFVGCEHTDGVHVVDLDTLEVSGKITTGDGSDAVAWWTYR